jgi:hypothetical protein
MKKIEAGEILPLEAHEKARATTRPAMIRLKEIRRVAVGPTVSLLFENRETVLWQIQEMCRVERIQDPAKVAEEVETYNSLIPPDGSLSATLFIEITEGKDVKPLLDRFFGIDEAGVLTLRIGDSHVVPGDFEPGHSSEEKISAVHYVHFHLDGPAREAFLDASVPAKLVLNHPGYRAEAALSGETRRSLMADLVDPAGAPR